ncbi:MAG: ABC transporter permease [Alphaproteobacteria bacterium 43-37]|nr:MAG: ABC transporter permease [Alphaproteobacteria bacterium 43-37]
MMNTIQFFGAFELGLIYGLVALGVYLSFRVLDFPDLTVDGSFPLGAAISGILIVSGYPPLIATLAAVVGGLMAGVITGWLTLRWKILNLLASILTMTALYSVNLRIMGRPNLSLLGEKTLFSFVPDLCSSLDISPTFIMPAIICLIALALWFILFWFLKTSFGLAIRATGANPRMSMAQGVCTKTTTYAGIAVSNGLVALGGSLFAQSQGFADVTVGAGTIIIGLASVIIGEALFHTRSILIALASCLVGSIIFRLIVALALNASGIGLQASDLNLVTSLLVAVAMIVPEVRKKLSVHRAKK